MIDPSFLTKAEDSLKKVQESNNFMYLFDDEKRVIESLSAIKIVQQSSWKINEILRK